MDIAGYDFVSSFGTEVWSREYTGHLIVSSHVENGLLFSGKELHYTLRYYNKTYLARSYFIVGNFNSS